jgi:hypothetical protein
LVEQRSRESKIICAVRIPVAVKTAEARSREGLVDGRVVLDPRVTLGHGAGIDGQLFRERRVHEAGRARPAAVMNEADDGTHSKLAQARQARVRPGPVGARQAVRRSALPEHRVAQGTEPKLCEEIEVFDSSRVPV